MQQEAMAITFLWTLPTVNIIRIYISSENPISAQQETCNFHISLFPFG